LWCDQFVELERAGLEIGRYGEIIGRQRAVGNAQGGDGAELAAARG